MKILLNNDDLIEALKNVKNLGFVPTMGGLHKGHISLIKKCQKKCKNTIVSIFVNPTQFNNKKDYTSYPRNYKKDLNLLKKLNVNFVYKPNFKDVYNFKRPKKIKLIKKDKILCAKFRKGHFEGVIDVMDRLTSLIKPNKIYMGEKDFQQLFLVKNYIKKRYKSTIVPCKTIRDINKLPFSSRNLHLNTRELREAGKITQNLITFKKKLSKKGRNINHLIEQKKIELTKIFKIKLEYLELRNKFNLRLSRSLKNSKIFFAFYINKIRLIDNI